MFGESSIRPWRLGYIVVIQLALIAVVVLSMASEGFAREESLGNGPITLTAKLHVGEALEEHYWLAGFSSDDTGRPDVLAITWSKASLGWLGSTWKLQLSSAVNALPSGLITQGEGFLEGKSVFELASIAPEPGHTYEVSMSVDPTLGVVAVSFIDEVNADKPIVDRGIQANAIDYRIYPALDFLNDHASHGVLSDIEIDHQFTPHGLRWNISQVFSDGVLRSSSAIDRRKPSKLHVAMPWEHLPGELVLSVYDGPNEEFRVEHPSNSKEMIIDLPSLSILRATAHEVSLQYVSNGSSTSLGSSRIHVGIIEAYIDEAEIEYTADEVKVRGELVVIGDGWLPTTDVGVDISLNKFILGPGSETNYYTLSPGPEVYRSEILTESISGIDLSPIRIGFDATVDVALEADLPYRSWNVLIDPKIESPFGTTVSGYEENIRVVGETIPDNTEPLRIMTYNIQAGVGMDGVRDITRIADVVAHSGADIIGFQEVDLLTNRSNGIDQPAVLAEMLGMNYYFGENLRLPGGAYGNLILSRYPLLSVDNILLPYQRGEQRGLVRAKVDYHGTPITVFVTHLGFQEDNIMQRKRILEVLYETEGPFILIGDFNMDPFEPVQRLNDMIFGMPPPIDPREVTARNIFDPIVRDVWMEFKSLPEHSVKGGMRFSLGSTMNPKRRRIDYIFISDEFEIENDDQGVFMIESLASDHLPVVTTLQLKR